MPRFPHGSRLPYILRHTVNLRFFFLVSIFCCSYVLWLQFPEENLDEYDQSLVDEALQNVAKDPRYAEVYRKKNHLPPGLKYILLWTADDWDPFPRLERGQKAFLTNKCPNINCYVTRNRYFFGDDLSRFHAIAFNGRNINDFTIKDLPKIRGSHQKYIYFNMESAANYPICSPIFDNFFNWTATYRLDSDIVYPYFLIKNNTGDVIGPGKNILWEQDMEDVDEDFASKLHNKTKAVAWFVSNCKSLSNREEFVTRLAVALKVLGLGVDIYGSCGPLKCPRDRHSECSEKLEKDYFFYLSLENSLAEDYVTEKLLTALQHNVIPIVYGGADYSRFLPPGSYLDIKNTSPAELASTMKDIISSHTEYEKYFRWKNYYSYTDVRDSECQLCEALNDKTRFKKYSSYDNFREWWNNEPCGRGFFDVF